MSFRHNALLFIVQMLHLIKHVNVFSCKKKMFRSVQHNVHMSILVQLELARMVNRAYAFAQPLTFSGINKTDEAV